MTGLGVALLWVAFVAALFGIIATWRGERLGIKKGSGASRAGHWATVVVAGALTLAILWLLVAFFREDFLFRYVAENHSPDTSSLAWLYKLSALWAGREGSFLLWAWILSLFALWAARKGLKTSERLVNVGVAVTNVILALFVAAMLFSEANNPFLATPAEYLDASGALVGAASSLGMNPLLQHWAMILHPPLLFIGYAGLTLPFAFAAAALILKDPSSRWVEIVGRPTVLAWLFLGAGIALGAVWAYVVLGWGGYWGWDPVENASLLPWLTGVALIHSFTVYRRRGGFKRWSVMLAAITFALVIFGTYITRSGVLSDTSVHSFSFDTLSLWLFRSIWIGVPVLTGLGLWLRRREFTADDEFESLASKDGAYYFNNVFMLVSAVLVAYLTLVAALPSWMPLGGFAIPASTYNTMARPIGILYLLILAVCPLLSWGGTDRATFWRRVRWPLAGTAVLGAGLLTIFFTTLKPHYDYMVVTGTEAGNTMAAAGPWWYYHGLAILGLLTAALLISVTVTFFITGARNRAKSGKSGFFSALWSILTKARTQSGGFLAHFGMGIILIGLIGSAMYVTDQTVSLPAEKGSQVEVGRYAFTYEGSESSTDTATGAGVMSITLDVARDGESIGTMTPGMKVFANGQQSFDAKVISEPLEDVFVAYQGADMSGGLSLNVKLNPLIWFTWSGAALLMVGTAIAAWPRRAKR
ncbi:MAG: heme lyase CcmF/NrfE family subunit [Coriobacteriia bacterium]